MNGRVAIVALLVLHVAVAAAEFTAPYPPDEQARSFALAPPTRLRWFDEHGGFHWRPFVSGLEVIDAPGPPRYREDPSKRHPLRWFVTGIDYQHVSRTRLFGVDGPMRVMLCGADELGRDQFSRFVHGGRLSLFAGLMATSIAVVVGLAVGLLAGTGGSVADQGAMFLADLVATVPWIYLLVAVRAALPLALPPAAAWLTIAGLVGAVGWVRPARMVRAVTARLIHEDFILAARSVGATRLHIAWYHLLPALWPVTATQAALLLPQCVLAEVTLSFLGLGIGEPTPSWGGLLGPVQHVGLLGTAWWLALPALALVPVFLLYYLLARSLTHRTV